MANTATNQEREMRVAVERIVGFAQEFGEAHLNLACHAAFPLSLTPDLLYQIWANFVPEAPWTAVARVLLSRLCKEVGSEMYEMDNAVRNLLLRELKVQFGQEKFNYLGEFLLEYVSQRLTEDDLDTQDLRQAQEWTALAYTKPEQAARELAQVLSDRVQQEDIGEVLRLSSLVETLSEPLIEAGFEPFVISINKFNRLKAGNINFKNYQGFNFSDLAKLNFSLNEIKLDLVSERGVDYTKLRDLLAEHKWKEADLETTRVILEASNKINRGFLNTEDINNFPIKDLQTIDKLWVNYSIGKFGFSIQKKVYISLKNSEYYASRIFRSFTEKVGWLKDNQLLSTDNITYSLQAPKGHLPLTGSINDSRFSSELPVVLNDNLTFMFLSRSENNYGVNTQNDYLQKKLSSTKYSKFYSFMKWIQALAETPRGRIFIHNLINDLKNNRLPQKIIIKLIEDIHKNWFSNNVDNELAQPILQESIYKNAKDYLCQGSLISNHKQCSKIITRQNLAKIMHDMRFGYDLDEIENLFTLLAEENIEINFPRVSWITQSQAIDNLLVNIPSQDKADILCENLGISYPPYTHIFELRYSESVMDSLKLYSPTCLDYGLFGREKFTDDNWGISLNLRNLEDGLPEATHAPKSFLSGELTLIYIGAISDNCPIYDWEKVEKALSFPVTYNSLTQLESFLLEIL